MIDKTEGKIELMLHAIIDRIKLYLGILIKAIDRCKKWIKSNKVKTGLIIGAIVFVVVTSLALYRFIPREVTLIVDDSRTITEAHPRTQCRTVEDFLEDQNIELAPKDVISVKLEDEIEGGMVIKIDRAFDVVVTADGDTATLTTTSCTVNEALAKVTLSTKPEDIVTPGRKHMLKAGENIVVKRVKIKYKKKKVVLPYDTQIVRTDKLRIGKYGVVTKGKNGKATKHYKLIYVDGKLHKTIMYKEVVHKEPRTKVVGYGTRISFDGPPAGLSYRKVINVTAVAYHFDGNPYGSGGRPCTYGTMAVDTRVIPMGTRCYVDGYGYAIANDIGSGVKGNKIDLYMEGGFQPLIWGARSTKVYILN